MHGALVPRRDGQSDRAATAGRRAEVDDAPDKEPGRRTGVGGEEVGLKVGDGGLGRWGRGWGYGVEKLRSELVWWLVWLNMSRRRGGEGRRGRPGLIDGWVG